MFWRSGNLELLFERQTQRYVLMLLSLTHTRARTLFDAVGAVWYHRQQLSLSVHHLQKVIYRVLYRLYLQFSCTFAVTNLLFFIELKRLFVLRTIRHQKHTWVRWKVCIHSHWTNGCCLSSDRVFSFKRSIAISAHFSLLLRNFWKLDVQKVVEIAWTVFHCWFFVANFKRTGSDTDWFFQIVNVLVYKDRDVSCIWIFLINFGLQRRQITLVFQFDLFDQLWEVASVVEFIINLAGWMNSSGRDSDGISTDTHFEESLPGFSNSVEINQSVHTEVKECNDVDCEDKAY